MQKPRTKSYEFEIGATVRSTHGMLPEEVGIVLKQLPDHHTGYCYLVWFPLHKGQVKIRQNEEAIAAGENVKELKFVYWEDFLEPAYDFRLDVWRARVDNQREGVVKSGGNLV